MEDKFSSKGTRFFSFQCNIHQGAGFSAFPPFPPPTRFASAEELQEQKVKIDLPPLFLFYFFWHPPLALSPSRSDSPSQHPRCLPGGGLVPPMGSIPTRGGGGRNPNLPPRGERSALAQIPFSILHRPSHLPWKHPQLFSIPVHLRSAHRVGARGICRAAS